MIDASSQFSDAIRAAGLTPPPAIKADGDLHRFPSNGKRGDDAGWYILHIDGDIPAGAFGCWRSNMNETWRADIGRSLTPAEREASRARTEAAQKKAAVKREELAKAAAAKATELWKASTEALPDHPYLVRKQEKPSKTLREISPDVANKILGYPPKAKGEHLTGRLLVAPVKVGEQLSTAELIDETGRKSALYGGIKTGGYWATGPLPTGDGTGLTLPIGEGVATCLTGSFAFTSPAVAALTSGNLMAVCLAMRAQYPAADLVVLADLGNGQKDAEDAARAVGARLVVPDFTGAKKTEKDTDINDMKRLLGIDAVKALIATATEPAPNSWPSLVSLDAPELPRLSANLLPGWAGDFAAAIAADTETPEELAVALVLAACATATARHLRVMIKFGYFEPTNLWMAVALPPGNRKSSVQKAACAPLLDWERKTAAEMAADIKRIAGAVPVLVASVTVGIPDPETRTGSRCRCRRIRKRASGPFGHHARTGC